jgi:hypothetical protein
VIELHEIRAEAEKDVLTVVDDFAGAGMLPGGSSAAEEGALLEQGDAKTVVGERAGRGESGQAASGDCDRGLG